MPVGSPMVKVYTDDPDLRRVQDRLVNTYNQLQSKLEWVLVGQAGGPTFQNGWINFDTNGSPSGRDARFTLDPLGFVVLSGNIKNGTVASTAWILPSGYRPNRQLAFAVTSNNAFGNLIIKTDGSVIPNAGSNLSFNLEVRFLAEA